MVGKYKLEIYNNRVHFELEIKRNITIIQGNSATGKTTLINMISEYERLGAGSGITLKCAVPCYVLPTTDWKQFIENRCNCILFVDENLPYIKSKEFATTINNSDIYIVIINRDSLPQLSYSVEEIYGIREDRDSQKYVKTKKVYNSLYNLYNVNGSINCNPKVVITEDSNAGNEFFSELYGKKCVSAEGKSKVAKTASEYITEEGDVLTIVDGAAFGADIQNYMRSVGVKSNYYLYTPESFEYLILKSGIVCVNEEKLDETYLYADSKKYVSWERYYTDLLVKETEGTQYKYSKQKLNSSFVSNNNINKIKNIMPAIIQE